MDIILHTRKWATTTTTTRWRAVVAGWGVRCVIVIVHLQWRVQTAWCFCFSFCLCWAMFELWAELWVNRRPLFLLNATPVHNCCNGPVAHLEPFFFSYELGCRAGRPALIALAFYVVREPAQWPTTISLWLLFTGRGFIYCLVTKTKLAHWQAGRHRWTRCLCRCCERIGLGNLHALG